MARKGLIHRFMRCESGATAIEYGLMAAIIGIGIVASLIVLRTGVVSLYSAASDGLTNAQ
jgi:pilus assembly protein Flp/PilA